MVALPFIIRTCPQDVFKFKNSNYTPLAEDTAMSAWFLFSWEKKVFFGAKLEDDYNKRHFLKGKQLYPQTGLDPLL